MIQQVIVTEALSDENAPMFDESAVVASIEYGITESDGIVNTTSRLNVTAPCAVPLTPAASV